MAGGNRAVRVFPRPTVNQLPQTARAVRDLSAEVSIRIRHDRADRQVIPGDLAFLELCLRHTPGRPSFAPHALVRGYVPSRETMRARLRKGRQGQTALPKHLTLVIRIPLQRELPSALFDRGHRPAEHSAELAGRRARVIFAEHTVLPPRKKAPVHSLISGFIFSTAACR